MGKEVDVLTVYLDLVMLLNFLVDFLLLLGTNRLSGFPAAPGRCALAAVFGSVYAAGCRALRWEAWPCASPARILPD